MDTPTRRDDWSSETISRNWGLLTEQVESFISSWEAGGDPPSLATFLPAEPALLRRMALIELIKVDLEYRWQHRELPKQIEAYVTEFPELREGGIPTDLIYEEFHIRRQRGESVEVADYYERFPQQAEDLGRMLGFDAAPRTTIMMSREAIQKVEVGATVDDFDLLAQLGEGAFATVFLARQRSMQRLVALKVSSDRGNEPQTMAQLDHPHIVRIYDQRQLADRGIRLLYMQYVPGGTLYEVLDHARQVPPAERHGRMFLEVIDRSLDRRGESAPADSSTRARLSQADWPTAICWIGARLATALDYAHQRGVLHRDIKPANVLLAADGTPKLVDFNVSFSATLDGVAPAAYFGGSLAYMSPEQLDACNSANKIQPEDLDHTCDIYSLGVMLWELLTTRRPFDDEAPQANWSATLDGLAAKRRAGVTPAKFAELPANMPPGLDQVLAKCLAPQAKDRFQTGGELARQLELCLQPRVQQLLRPRVGNWRERARRWPLTALLIGAIIPNLVVSVPNIFYNEHQIVKTIATKVGKQVDVLAIFQFQIMMVNPFVYGVGIAVCATLGWIAIRAVRALYRGEVLPQEDLVRARLRCLHMGGIISTTSFILWALSGVIFAGWLRGRIGDTVDMGLMSQFMLSQLLSGLMAATATFFLVTFITTRSLYPLLVRPESSDPRDGKALTFLGRRCVATFAVAIVVPFVGVFIAVALQTANQVVFAGLSGMGLISSGICFWLMREILDDLGTLAAAVSPDVSLASSSSDTFGSFWSHTRR